MVSASVLARVSNPFHCHGVYSTSFEIVLVDPQVLRITALVCTIMNRPYVSDEVGYVITRSTGSAQEMVS